MSRLIMCVMLAFASFTALAQDRSVAGFNDRFGLVKNAEGKVTSLRLKRATMLFSVRPFILQLKKDILALQQSLDGMSERELDDLLLEMGVDPYAYHLEGQQEAQTFKEAILNVKHVDVESAFRALDHKDFWTEFQTRLNEAVLFLDPTIIANLEDSRFFYKRNVTHRVVVWALNEAKKRFSHLPVLNIASFVIVRVHDMMLEQRHFAHNMLLHYFENIPEGKLGMTKLEIDRAVSSIYEYRIEATSILESNNAARDWLNYGMNKFYMSVRAGNAVTREWTSGLSPMAFSNVKKLNWAFAEVTHENVRKIYHLHHRSFMFSPKPSLAYDYSKPQQVKQLRALLNIGATVLGFLKIPDGLKSSVHSFMNSFYVQQVRTEGALVAHFETSGNTQMLKSIFAQRSNLYILE